MTTKDEALKLALEALEDISSHYMSLPKKGCMALAAIEEALAEQPAQQQSCYCANCEVLGKELQALKAQQHQCSRSHPHENMDAMCELRTEIARLTNKNARLKAQQQEPLNDGPISDGWQLSVSRGHSGYGVYAHMVEYPEEGAVLLFSLGEPDTSPQPSKPWVGLTDEEINEFFEGMEPNNGFWLSFARAIEAKLREKNA